MRKESIATLGLAFGVALAAPANAGIEVSFVEPQTYTDVGRYDPDAEHNLKTLEGHFVRLGGRCIAPDQTLAVRVLDVDLAGRDEWWHRDAYDLRVMRDITWPRIDLEFAWRDAQGAILAEGRERVADMNYLSRSAWVRDSSNALPYEQAMLRDWFERRFCRAGRPTS